MLTSLSIKNYALIDNLHVTFNNGLTIITGETGAGKSILLGGLSLVLGKRADLSSVKNTSEKCVIEASFDIANQDLKSLFEENDLDYEPQTIIRREILPSGKSRAFVNDTPANLESLKTLSQYLIDVHSQHETLELTNNAFQFQIIDALAKNSEILGQYSGQLSNYKQLNQELEKLKQYQSEAVKEYDYNMFLLKELQEAQLVEGELHALEEEYEALNNVEEIKEKLQEADHLLNDEQIGILNLLRELKSISQKLSGFGSGYLDLHERINSSLIELDDVYGEVSNLHDQLENDPNRLEIVNTKLQTIHNLFLKHNKDTIEELISIKEELSKKVSLTENLDSDIQKLDNHISHTKKQLKVLAKQLHDNRKKAIPKLIKHLQNNLKDLGMPNAQFKIDLNLGEDFFNNGSDTVEFLFTANKGMTFMPLKKAASGGELSRIMLSVKYILSQFVQLPTIIFDEIDTGVSGEISNKMASIMQQMSRSMQVLTITHLPQIAAKGDVHFKVFKEDKAHQTTTNLVRLNNEERIVEIAQMLGGKDISSSALAHAKQLLN